MPAATPPATPEPGQAAAFYLGLLQKLALAAVDLAELAQRQAHAAAAEVRAYAPDAGHIRNFERMARCVRQCAAIAHKIEQDQLNPPSGRPRGNAAARRLPANGAAVRSRVEHAIRAGANPEHAEDLLADLYERLEEPEILHMLARQGADATVAALCAELGLHEPLGDVTNLTDEELADWVDRLDPVPDDPDDPFTRSWQPPARPASPHEAQAPP